MLKQTYTAEAVNVSRINDNEFNDIRVPYYQRPYSWTEKNVKQLIDDINKEKKEYLIGNITCKTKERVSSIYIIDGQQRLTTIMLISLSLLLFYWSVTGKKESKIYSFIYKGGQSKKRNTLWLTSNGLDEKPLEKLGKEVFETVNNKKESKEDFNSIYKKVVSNVNESDDGNITKMFAKICQYFSKDIFIKKQSIHKDIVKFFNKYGGKNSIIKFILIGADVNDSESIKIFNNINEKGKPLEQIDLLKNYIFSKITKESDIKEYFTLWGDINKVIYNLTDYVLTFLRSDGKMWNGAFKEKIFEVSFNTTPKVMKFVKDLNAKKQHYLYFLEKTKRDKINKNIDKASTNLAKFSMDLYRAGNYKFVRPVIFKIFTEDNKYTKIFTLVNFCFMAKTLGLLSLKDIEDTMKEISTKGLGYIDSIISKIVKEKTITKDRIKEKLIEYTADAYSKKNMTKFLLAYYQAQGDASYIDILINEYDEKNLQIDHHISKKAKKGDYSCYYNSKTNRFDFDSTSDFDYDGSVDADEFVRTRLNNIGNLSFMSRIQNNKKKNKIDRNIIKLLENKEFSADKGKNWKTIKQRQDKICDYLCERLFSFAN